MRIDTQYFQDGSIIYSSDHILSAWIHIFITDTNYSHDGDIMRTERPATLQMSFLSQSYIIPLYIIGYMFYRKFQIFGPLSKVVLLNIRS
jgi:hypothetical protein